jgi:hypothetical protein
VDVRHLKTNVENAPEEPSYWLLGTAAVQWRVAGGRPGDGTATVPVGCWADTDDDHAEWCSDNEGANIIAQCMGMDVEGDNRGSFARLAFPSECEALGGAVCHLLREAAPDEAMSAKD